MHSNQATFQQYLQGPIHSSTTAAELSEKEDLMAEFFFMKNSTLAQPQGGGVGSGLDPASGIADAQGYSCYKQEQPPSQSGTGSSYAPSQILNAITGGPICPRKRHPKAENTYPRARPNSYRYHSTIPNLAALYLPLVSDDGEEMLTKNICQRLVYELNSRGIAQHMFAEKVLRRTQGTLSDLLNNPTDFRVLTARGRIAYQKMITWINLNEKDKQLALDGKLAICGPGEEPDAEQPNKVGNKKRTIINPYQNSVLQDAITKNSYPTRADKDALATQLDLPRTTVDYWFNNARKRSKQ